jgi:hypothetical protein
MAPKTITVVDAVGQELKVTLGSEKGLEKCLGQHGAQCFVHHKHGNVYDFESLEHGAKYRLVRQQQQQRSIVTHGLPALGPISTRGGI